MASSATAACCASAWPPPSSRVRVGRGGWQGQAGGRPAGVGPWPAPAVPLPGAVAVAEFIAESPRLLRLDLRENEIKTGGLMALSLALKVNHSLLRLDLDREPKKEAVSGLFPDSRWGSGWGPAAGRPPRARARPAPPPTGEELHRDTEGAAR